ncbi:hypothetical protein QQS21_008045 [Conoideocrella luteorostrata]|uniref:Vacuolar sorting protein Vps3844 C-terminal domain-containing protein n=1 Tax=Conoideocrella luteorostrata TaxID=1105319 RepID=A0AAJ0FRJ7_9HYPO|nr:hypothetical protein QQS21_008045 [Conoideocrella luteorostrata]
MKLTAGIVAAIAGCATAAQQSAEVFIVPAIDAASPPAVTPGLARLLFLQRLSSNGRGLNQHDIPNGVDTEKAVSFLNRYGKTTPTLFSDGESSQPSQLILMLDEMSDKHMKELRKGLGMSPSFTIADPPADKAHKDLIELDILYRTGVADGNKCSVQQVSNPIEDCWDGKASAVAKYSANEDSEIIQKIAKQIKQIIQLAKSGDLETAIIALPSSKSSNKWTDEQQELRRRQAEQVMSAIDIPEADPETTSSATPNPVLFAPSGRIPPCFDSESACNKTTQNCSGHGVCKNKYGGSDEAENDGPACFACHCQATREKGQGVTHWGGSSCSKQDVSVPFWLFAGFTIFMVGILSMSIGLLFNVGEEKLPGVIGAGVSRSK